MLISYYLLAGGTSSQIRPQKSLSNLLPTNDFLPPLVHLTSTPTAPAWLTYQKGKPVWDRHSGTNKGGSERERAGPMPSSSDDIAHGALCVQGKPGTHPQPHKPCLSALFLPPCVYTHITNHGPDRARMSHENPKTPKTCTMSRHQRQKARLKCIPGLFLFGTSVCAPPPPGGRERSSHL
jgi:hypothetical protein